MKVARWENWKTRDDEGNLGGLGGFFNMHVSGQRWEDYIARFYPEWHPHMEALRAEIVARQLWQDGNWHQDEDADGVPVLDDGSYFQGSMRAWGDLLAAVWSTEHDRDYCYTDFAWEVPESKEGQPPSPPPMSYEEFIANHYEAFLAKMKAETEAAPRVQIVRTSDA